MAETVADPFGDGRTRERFLQVALLGGGLVLLSAVTLIGARSADGKSLSVGDAMMLLAPLVPLLLGLANLAPARRGRAPHSSALLLLLVVPVTVASGLVLSPGRLDPIVFCVRAGTLLAYVIQTLRLLNDRRASVTSPIIVLPAPLAGARARLQRRVYIYRSFVALGVLAFALPLYRAITTTGSPLQALAAAGLLAVLACRAFLVDTLDRHLQRDPALEDALARLRRHARRGRPLPSFYAVAAIAIVAMVAFVWRVKLGWS